MSKLEKNNDQLKEEALARHIKMTLELPEECGPLFDIGHSVIKRIFAPELVGADRIPKQPCLFVGNHSIFAMDAMLLVPMLWKEQGRYVRAMGDRALFGNEKIGQQLVNTGAVMGHPAVCTALMQAGKDMTVFPGGARETSKTTKEAYQLIWGERFGFVRLAAMHGYTIVPMGIVGPEEFYGHAIEAHELPDSMIGKILKRFGVLNEDTRSDLLMPIPTGMLGSLLPKPQRCFYGFGEPLDLSAEKGKTLDKPRLAEIRDQVAERIEQQIADMLLLRQQRKGEDGLLRRLLTV